LGVEKRWVGLPSGLFCRCGIVAVQVVDVDGLKGVDISGAHGDVGEAVKPVVVGDERYDAAAASLPCTCASPTIRRSAMRKNRM